MTTSVFIDGAEGSTGLEVRSHLIGRDDIRLLEIDPAERKSNEAKRSIYAGADIVVLCLPDEAAIEAVQLASGVRFIDASTAHRVSEGWVYGLPELAPGQRSEISRARSVSNPGCYPTGFVLSIRPLVDEGIIDADKPVHTHALSGYSGGGKKLIGQYSSVVEDGWQSRPYGLSLTHKHLPEMTKYAALSRAPVFAPSVGSFYKGMLVQSSFDVSELRKKVSPEDIVDIYRARYENEPFVHVIEALAVDELDGGFLSATDCNDTNRIDLMVFGSTNQLLVVARLDNLGKGASSAAVQNLNLMTGAAETTGLVS